MDANTRLNWLYLLIGTTGTGKTTRGLTLARTIAKAHNCQLIICDEVYRNEYSKMKVIGLQQLSTCKHKEFVVIHDEMEEVAFVLNNAKVNAVTVWEDCGTYLNGNISETWKRYIKNHRKWNFEVIFMYHFISEVPPYVRRLWKKMVLHKTADDLTVKQTWVNWPQIKTVAERVMKDKNYNYAEVISFGE